jgi:hypothetical protein
LYRAKALKQGQEGGIDAFKVGKPSEAYGLYTESLKIDPINMSTN